MSENKTEEIRNKANKAWVKKNIDFAWKRGLKIGYAACLYEKCGYSYSQIAEEIGLTESGVRTLLKDVLKKD